MGKKIVYIVGLGHSGSTMLDLTLGQHSKIIGLGEIATVLNLGLESIRERAVPCACGNSLDNCSFWSNVDKALGKVENPSFQIQYQAVINTAQRIFGKDCIVVDSSKGLGSLKKISKLPDMDVKVLHLIRDVRPFTVSYLDRMKRRKEKAGNRQKSGKFPKSLLQQFASYYFLIWYRQNRKIQHYLSSLDVPVLQIGYEELCLYPKKMVGKICEFLALEAEAALLNWDKPQSHIIRGNIMRVNAGKWGIYYDNRWFYRKDWLMPSLFFPHIMKYNNSEVYKNTAGTVWEISQSPVREEPSQHD